MLVEFLLSFTGFQIFWKGLSKVAQKALESYFMFSVLFSIDFKVLKYFFFVIRVLVFLGLFYRGVIVLLGKDFAI